jgi:hypothetical protein
LGYDGATNKASLYDKDGNDLGITLGEVTLGSNLLGSVADADVPRIEIVPSTFAGVEYTLVWESAPVGEKGFRQYISPIGVLVETVNAIYSNVGNTWSKDIGGQPAIRRTLGSGATAGFVIEYQESGTDVWGDGAWTSNVLSVNETAFDALVAASGVLTATSIVDQINQLRDGKHGDRTIWMSPGDAGIGQLTGDLGHFSLGNGFPYPQSIVGGATRYVTYPLTFNVGSRLKEVSVFGFAGNAAGEELEAKIRRAAVGSSEETVSTTKTSAASGGAVSLTWDTTDTDFTPDGHVMTAAGYGCVIRIPPTSSAAELIITLVKVTYDHP